MTGTLRELDALNLRPRKLADVAVPEANQPLDLSTLFTPTPAMKQALDRRRGRHSTASDATDATAATRATHIEQQKARRRAEREASRRGVLPAHVAKSVSGPSALQRNRVLMEKAASEAREGFGKRSVYVHAAVTGCWLWRRGCVCVCVCVWLCVAVCGCVAGGWSTSLWCVCAESRTTLTPPSV